MSPVFIALFALLVCAWAQQQPTPTSNYYLDANPNPYRPGRQAGRFRPQENYPPQPYNFDYNVNDGFGNSQYRQESGDQNGIVKGTYGYYDAEGVYRNVDYIADSYGFRATIRTNEPGVGPANPADVNLEVHPPPAGLQERYTKPGGGARPPISRPVGRPVGGRRPPY